ncbi:MAG: flagellar filament capping protein FliD [Fuerstiella sp.]|nr:flagellar filament capping protein FliD [Fuerstiella sp.]
MPITIDGLVFGLDTETIVKGLLDIQQVQLDRIELKRADVLAEQATFASLEAQLISFQFSVSSLARVSKNPFERQVVNVSDDTILSGTASSSAANGTYRMTVNSVAKAHQVASLGFADADSEITLGDIELRVGSGDLVKVEVDSTNNTLAGLAESINASDSGISASLIQDSSGGATPYKLLLTATDTGADNTIAVTNNLAASSGNAIQPTFDFGNPVQAAENAQVTLGSGAGAITVESSTNRFDNLIDGVTLDLLNVSDGNEVTLTVAQNTDDAVSAVQDLVTSFNSVMSFIDDRSRYDEATESGGVLLGNRSAIAIQQKLRNAVTSVVPGVATGANRLSAIGVSVTDNGRLQLDEGRLRNVVSGGENNVSRDDLKRLFTLDAQSSNSKVSFVLGSLRTKPSTTAYQVDLTQAAAKATIVADTALSGSTDITSANRTLEVEIDGAEATVTLNEGTYTDQELANHLESLISGASDLNGRTANVGLSSGVLTITSDIYGRSSTIKVIDGTAVATLGFSAGASDTGRDVAGTFVVDGVTETAIGRGQVLSGHVDNENTADLQLRIKLSDSEIISGAEADVTVTQGLAATLNSILDDMLDPINGGLKTIDERFDTEAQSLQDSLDRQQSLFDLQRESLIREFVALETSLSELKSTGDFLTTQLASLNAAQKNNK